MNFIKGFFITFEGTDGSGKSTQIKLLENYLITKNFNVTTTREPGGTFVSEQIRELIINKKNIMDDVTEAYLYAAARAEHVNKIIKPSLEKGNIVLCDRFLDSSLAYQGAARGLGFEIVHEINRFAIDNIFPDITFLLALPPEESIKRKKAQSDLDRIEAEDTTFHKKVYDGFIKLSELYSDRFFTIDAKNTISEIHYNIISIINTIIK